MLRVRQGLLLGWPAHRCLRGCTGTFHPNQTGPYPPPGIASADLALWHAEDAIEVTPERGATAKAIDGRHEGRSPVSGVVVEDEGGTCSCFQGLSRIERYPHLFSSCSLRDEIGARSALLRASSQVTRVEAGPFGKRPQGELRLRCVLGGAEAGGRRRSLPSRSLKAFEQVASGRDSKASVIGGERQAFLEGVTMKQMKLLRSAGIGIENNPTECRSTD